jgi:2-keto-4-pentenoate hydratase
METGVIAAELMEALDHATSLPPVSDRAEGLSVLESYSIGAELVARRRARGERTIGRKLGFTNQALWAMLGVDAPFWAYVYGTTVMFLEVPAGNVSLAGLTQPRLEPELVLHFASAPPAAPDETSLLAHIDWIAPAFEIVQCHFPDWVFRTPDAIADFGVHGLLAVGPPTLIATLDDPVGTLRNFTVVLARDGVTEATGGGANVLGSPLRALAEVMGIAVEHPGWEPVRAGEIVTTGTLTGLHKVRSGETWQVDTAGIPLESIQLRIG